MRKISLLLLFFLPGCSWLQSDAGRYCYCKVDQDDSGEIQVEFEYNHAESESSKEAEIPAL